MVDGIITALIGEENETGRVTDRQQAGLLLMVVARAKGDAGSNCPENIRLLVRMADVDVVIVDHAPADAVEDVERPILEWRIQWRLRFGAHLLALRRERESAEQSSGDGAGAKRNALALRIKVFERHNCSVSAGG